MSALAALMLARVLYWQQPEQPSIWDVRMEAAAEKRSIYCAALEAKAEREAIEAAEKAARLESWARQHRYHGIIYADGWTWTWYSQRVLPGNGLSIPGRHVGDGGYIMDGDDFICLASSVLPYGTIIATPMGVDGKVYDSGCAANVVDVYVDW